MTILKTLLVSFYPKGTVLHYQFGPVSKLAELGGHLEVHVDVGVAKGAPARLGRDGVAPAVRDCNG